MCSAPGPESSQIERFLGILQDKSAKRNIKASFNEIGTVGPGDSWRIVAVDPGAAAPKGLHHLLLDPQSRPQGDNRGLQGLPKEPLSLEHRKHRAVGYASAHFP